MSSCMKMLYMSIALIALTEYSGCKKMEFKSGDCKYNRDTFSNLSFKIIQNKVKLDLMVIRMLPLGLKAHVGFEFRLNKARAYQSLFEHDINYCQLIKGAQQSMYRRWFVSMLKVGNFATSCPIAAGYYYLNEFTIDSNLIPSFLYLGDYRIDFGIFYGKYRKRNDNTLLHCYTEAIIV